MPAMPTPIRTFIAKSREKKDMNDTTHEAIRTALEQMIEAVDTVIEPPPENADLDDHYCTIQANILAHWMEMVLLTDNRDLAERNGFEIIETEKTVDRQLPFSPDAWVKMQTSQPIVPFHRMDDLLQAMGVALTHIGAAVLQYASIRESSGAFSGGCANVERYCRAEVDARLAHAILHRVHTKLAPRLPFGLEMQKHCRQAKLWLTRERSLAARELGIDPPPRASNDLCHAELDCGELDCPEPGHAEPDRRRPALRSTGRPV